MAKYRPTRILWANQYCLLDTSSGASMSVLTILNGLYRAGAQVKVLGATIFDQPVGTLGLRDYWDEISRAATNIVKFNEDGIEHTLIKTRSKNRKAMTSEEEGVWFAEFQKIVTTYRPDVVMFYGGQVLDLLMASYCRTMGIPCVAYVTNPNYSQSRWCHDVDLIVTDTLATANFYKERHLLDLSVIGKFINPKVISSTRTPETANYITMVNPSFEKGGLVMGCLAAFAQKKYPELKFLIVNSRGKWEDILNALEPEFGREIGNLGNTTVVQHTLNMSDIYTKTKLLMVPSLWHESGARVIPEALLNGIPVVATDKGGARELIGDAGYVVKLPDIFYEHPYNKIPGEEVVSPLCNLLYQLTTNNTMYSTLSKIAHDRGKANYDLSKNIQSFVNILAPLTQLKAGDRDPEVQFRNTHKQVNPSG